MKKIILAVILMAAAGGAVYLFATRNHNVKPALTNSYQESIIGDWKIESIDSKDTSSIGLLLLSLDSNLTNYTIRFTVDGNITQLLNDSIVGQKGKYEWKDSSQLLIIEGDSLADQELMHITTLTTEQLKLISADSSKVHFKKKK